MSDFDFTPGLRLRLPYSGYLFRAPVVGPDGAPRTFRDVPNDDYETDVGTIPPDLPAAGGRFVDSSFVVVFRVGGDYVAVLPGVLSPAPAAGGPPLFRRYGGTPPLPVPLPADYPFREADDLWIPESSTPDLSGSVLAADRYFGEDLYAVYALPLGSAGTSYVAVLRGPDYFAREDRSGSYREEARKEARRG